MLDFPEYVKYVSKANDIPRSYQASSQQITNTGDLLLTGNHVPQQKDKDSMCVCLVIKTGDVFHSIHYIYINF